LATILPTLEVPDHVPAGLVRDFDFDAYCYEGDDPFLAASRMLAGLPECNKTGER
jgi:hypothetical protein